MIQPTTFLEFIKESYINDKIYDNAFEYCEHHHSFLCNTIRSNDVYRIFEVSDIDLDYRYVWIDDTKDSTINFDVAIEVNADGSITFLFRNGKEITTK